MAQLGNTIVDGVLRVNGDLNADKITGNLTGNVTGKLTGDITGNSGTTTKLKTPVTINGVNFDGSVNITVADSTKLPLEGGTLTGDLTLPNLTCNESIKACSFLGDGTTNYYHRLEMGKSNRDVWNFYEYGGVYNFYKNTTLGKDSIQLLGSINSNGWTGNVKGNVTGNVTGDVSGNAGTATKLKTARTIALTGSVTGSGSFDGSGNLSIATTTNHKHTDSMIRYDFDGRSTVGWLKLGTLVSSGDSSSTYLKILTGSGYNGNATQNSTIDIHIKDGYQATTSTTNACGVMVYKLNADSANVKVMATTEKSYDVYLYCPWSYASGCYFIYGKYSSWTHSGTYSDDEPTTGVSQNKIESNLALKTSSITGNAATATKLQTARTIGVSGITGTAQSFNGTANITIPITAVPSSLLTNKNSINGSEITNDKNWVASSDKTVNDIKIMTEDEYIENKDKLIEGSVIIIENNGSNLEFDSQKTALTCNLPLDL